MMISRSDKGAGPRHANAVGSQQGCFAKSYSMAVAVQGGSATAVLS